MPRVMIADDDEFIRYYLKNLLEYIKFTVVAECGNGEDIFDVFWESKPDILLLDIHMPGINGDKFLMDNKEFVKDTLVIILTMSISEEIRHNLEEQGYKYFLRKNISPTELIQTIQAIWNEYSEAATASKRSISPSLKCGG